jgi:hypothetical protein
MAPALLYKPIYGLISVLNVKLPYNTCFLFIFFVLSENTHIQLDAVNYATKNLPFLHKTEFSIMLTTLPQHRASKYD